LDKATFVSEIRKLFLETDEEYKWTFLASSSSFGHYFVRYDLQRTANEEETNRLLNNAYYRELKN